jgi:hypothetical protein
MTTAAKLGICSRPSISNGMDIAAVNAAGATAAQSRRLPAFHHGVYCESLCAAVLDFLNLEVIASEIRYTMNDMV